MYYAFRSWSIEGHSNPPQQLSRGVAFMPFRELIAPPGKWVSLRFPLSELFSIRKDCFTPRSFRKGLCLCKDPTVNTCFIICPAVYFISLPTTNNFWVARKIKSTGKQLKQLEKNILFTRSSGGKPVSA